MDYFTFKGTKYQSANHTYFMLAIGIVLFWLEGIYLSSLFAMYHFRTISFEAIDDHHTAELLSKALIDMVLTISMIYIFLNKILLILKTNSNEISNEDRQSLLAVSAKISILSIIALVSTQLIIAISAVNCIIYMWKDDRFFQIFFYHQIVLPILVVLDSTISAICVYLTLPYEHSTRLYIKCCSGCQSFCLLMAKRHLKSDKSPGEYKANIYYQL